MSREERLVRTMVHLADTLVDEFDVVDLLSVLADRCVEVLDVAAAGIMLARAGGGLHVVASSSETSRTLELFEVQSAEGPCLDCYRLGHAVVNEDLATAVPRWPHFAPVALEAGFRSAHALPMRLRGNVIGALNFFRTGEGAIDEEDVTAAQALADVATIAILQHRVALEAQTLNEQLNFALNSRIAIEQAKGVLAEQAGIDVDEAFRRLRAHARHHNRRLVEVAQDVVEGDLDAGSLDRPV